MRVSWLIPVRDGRQWLARAVDSALAECGPDDEVIVIDDGSADHPEEVLEQTDRVRLVRQSAAGITVALEHGRSLCQGQWIARLDCDDEALPGRISAQLEMLNGDDGLAAVGGRARIVRDDGPVPEGMQVYVAWVNGLADPMRELLVESPLFHPAVLMRSSAVDAVGGYRDGDLPEDYDLWLRLVSAGWKLGSVPMDVVQIRDRAERLTRTDPRYRRAAFEAVKQDWLKAGVLDRACRVVVWGAGRTGRRWIRWLKAEGHTIPAVIDVYHRTERQGVPILEPEALVGMDFDVLIMAVGTRGARAEIRARLQALRPDVVEGRDWWAVV